MNSLQRVYTRDIIKLFIVSSLLFSLVFTLIGLFDRYDDYVSAGLRGLEIAEVAFMRLPEFLGYLIPLSFMLSVVLVVSFATKHREILILRVAGGHLRKFLVPLIYLAIVVVVFQVFVQEVIYPVANGRAQSILQPDSKGFLYKSGVLWLRPDMDTIMRAGGFDPYQGQMSDVYVFFFKGSEVKKIVYARRAFVEKGRLRLKNVISYNLFSKKVTEKDTLIVNTFITEDILQAGRKRIEELSGLGLLRIYSSLKDAGIENVKLGVDLQRRLSYPLLTLVLALLGMYLSVRFSSPWLAVGISTTVAVAVWGGITLFTALGYAGTISPVMAGWFLPGTGLVVAGLLFTKIRL